MLNLFLIAGLISLSSIFSVIFLQRNLKSFIDKNSNYFISFSAGVFLVTAGFIISESFEISESILQTTLLVILGFTLSKLLTFVFPEVHHHHDKNCSGHKRKSIKIIIGDSIHNIADGLILASSFLLSPILLFPIVLSIMIHEILQEISEFFVLVEDGYSIKKALIINFLTSTTIFIGVIIGIFLKDSVELQAIILAVSSGFFLNLVFDDLLPHKHHKQNKLLFFKHLAILICGLAIMIILIGVTSHSHSH